MALKSLGCKVNQAEVEEWAPSFLGMGYEVVPFDEVADVYVVNTCSVTHVADRKSRQLLRQARRHNPAALVVATGCYAAVAPDEVARLTGADLVVGRDDKMRLVYLVHEALEGPDERPVESTSWLAAGRSRARALVKIADGCDKSCAFCIVPYARGRARSVSPSEVVEKVRGAVQAGYREVVLTAVHMGTYGRDLSPAVPLRELLGIILSRTPVERLRLSSIEPEDFDLDLLALWDRHAGRLCRHFHLALDSGCDATLRRMRRRYTTQQYADLVRAIRAVVPGAAITADVMVGFPGETEAEFAESYAFVQAMGFAQTHVFKYSARRRTAAAKLPEQVPEDVKRERAQAMLALATVSARRYRAGLLGSTLDVLYEAPTEDCAASTWQGLTDNYVRVFVPSATPLANELLPTRLIDEHPGGLVGCLAT